MPSVSRTLAAAFLATTLAATGCASAGAFPESGDAAAAIAGAERLIRDAERAGADSFATEPLAAARRNLATAQGQRDARQLDRAALTAREAQADATLAREAAERAKAQRARDAAATAARQLPPGGAR